MIWSRPELDQAWHWIGRIDRTKAAGRRLIAFGQSPLVTPKMLLREKRRYAARLDGCGGCNIIQQAREGGRRPEVTFFEQIIWDLDNDPQGNVRHIARHQVTPEEVEEVLVDPHSVTMVSKSSGEQITFGYTAGGRYLAVAWQMVSDDPLIARPITAFDPSSNG